MRSAASVQPTRCRGQQLPGERVAGDQPSACPKAIFPPPPGRAHQPAGFADALTTRDAQLLEMMGTDVFAFHGYTEFFLEEKWVKATPAFNLTLCQRFDVLPLEFDGRTDSIFHPYDAGGRRHMEYIRDRGTHADLPFDEMVRVMRETYPRFAAHFQAEDAPPRDEMFDPE
jgi:hypothetical protein